MVTDAADRRPAAPARRPPPRAATDTRAVAQLERRLEAFVRRAEARHAELDRGPAPRFIASDLASVRRGLERVVAEGLARGPVFCEWGSGLGSATCLAALLSFEACGIEIEDRLVHAARQLAREFEIDARFAHGDFLLPGDAALMAGSHYAHADDGPDAWAALALDPGACDVVFAYPWPGEEALLDTLFLRRTRPGALLLTFHGDDLLLAQRHLAGAGAPGMVGWI